MCCSQSSSRLLPESKHVPGQTSCVLFRDLPPLLLQGSLYREKAMGKASPGAVSLVLGAGNQLPVVAGDILHKLVLEDEVVVCKMNPVNEYLGPHIRCAAPGYGTARERCNQSVPSRGARTGCHTCWCTACPAAALTTHLVSAHLHLQAS